MLRLSVSIFSMHKVIPFTTCYVNSVDSNFYVYISETTRDNVLEISSTVSESTG